MKNAIPNFLTLCNLFCGVVAIILMDLFWSPILLVFAAFFDLFDGAAARALGVTSEIGKELDSLCDMVSFGVAPALLYWLLVPNPHPAFVAVPLALAGAAAWRLARFNTLPPLPYFLGMPTPISAMAIVGLCLGIYHGNPTLMAAMDQPVLYVVIGIVLAWSMNRNRRMLSSKGWSIPEDRNWMIAYFVGGLVLLAIDRTSSIFFIICWYVLINEIRAWISPAPTSV